MKKNCTLAIVLFLGSFLLSLPGPLPAQSYDPAVVAPGLRLALEEEPEAFHSVMMLLADRADPRAMEEDFRRRKASLQERAYALITALQAKASATQPAMLSWLSSSPHVNKESIRPFWITNVIFFEARREAIAALSRDPAVERLDINWEIMIPDNEEEAVESEALQNSRERGLAAIGATEMWAMGYTGHGRKALIVDSGHDIFHPAVHNNFAWHYLPMDEAWANPGEPYACGDHGVHVGGTVVGLDRLLRDTIGVAYDALWLGSSHSSCGAPGSALNYVSIYQWAMNPDGDPSTIDDMPDAINNSWSANYPTINDCFDPVHISITDAAMAAGIAIIFSASNEGPAPMTIGDPPMNNWDTVRMFAVGWLDGNNPNFPIAAGSSRGPTVCGGEGSLLIKPEVSAPGNNVRSSLAGGGYGSLSGTSMATPHVTGATVLLKEAFPYLPGEELMKALYYSAIDLGVPGEDNDYGMGIINLPAAFNYLASRGNEPAPPVVAPNDAVLLRIGAQELNCEESISPVIEVENNGSETFTSMEAAYSLFGASSVSLTYAWEGELAPGAREVIRMPKMSSPSGAYEYVVEIRKVNGTDDARKYNNRLKKRVRLIADENFTASVLGNRATCRNSNAFVQASLVGPGSVRWYDEPVGGSLLGEGASTLIPVGEEASTVYAEVLPEEKAGRTDNLGSPVQYENQQRGLVFDVFNPITIRSVKVYTEEAGSRLLQLIYPDGTTFTKVAPMVAGEQRVALNWHIDEPGEGYRLELRAGKPLGFSLGGSSYPYNVENVVSITGSTEGAAFYYYFYDWAIEFPYYCGRIPVDIGVQGAGDVPAVAFSPSEITVDISSGANTVSFTDQSVGGTFWLWDFGDGNTSTQRNPIHTYADTGVYNVILTVIGQTGCASSVAGAVTVTESGVTSVAGQLKGNAMVAFPNPAQEALYLAFRLEQPALVDYQLADLLGRPVLRGRAQLSGEETVQLSLAELPAGAYLLVVDIEGQRLAQRVVKSR